MADTASCLEELRSHRFHHKIAVATRLAIPNARE